MRESFPDDPPNGFPDDTGGPSAVHTPKSSGIFYSINLSNSFQYFPTLYSLLSTLLLFCFNRALFLATFLLELHFYFICCNCFNCAFSSTQKFYLNRRLYSGYSVSLSCPNKNSTVCLWYVSRPYKEYQGQNRYHIGNHGKQVGRHHIAGTKKCT